jgi:predicted amino acid racemase
LSTPYLTIDIGKIEHNSRCIVDLCASRGIEVAGVTKGVCGHPEIARAMLRAGVSEIADSRLANIDRLRKNGVDARFMLVRVPALSEAERVVESVDLSLNSELAVLAALSRASHQRGSVHEVIVMVDLGDLREGVWPDELMEFVGSAVELPGIRVKGLGTNLACFSGVIPNEYNMGQLVDLAEQIESTYHFRLELVSGANSSGLALIHSGRLPGRINHARIGEAILLGRETTQRTPWPGTFQDAFTLGAEVLQLRKKPSIPRGDVGQDAFGNRRCVPDRGDIVCALVNVGREDVDVGGVTPWDPRLSILGASSGYLALDASDAASDLRVGDELLFSLNYSALLAAMTSEYVEKRVLPIAD